MPGLLPPEVPKPNDEQRLLRRLEVVACHYVRGRVLPVVCVTLPCSSPSDVRLVVDGSPVPRFMASCSAYAPLHSSTSLWNLTTTGTRRRAFLTRAASHPRASSRALTLSIDPFDSGLVLISFGISCASDHLLPESGDASPLRPPRLNGAAPHRNVRELAHVQDEAALPPSRLQALLALGDEDNRQSLPSPFCLMQDTNAFIETLMMFYARLLLGGV